MTRIHPLAYVDPTAELGEGTEVGPFAYVGAGVKLGRGNVLRAHAVVEGPGTTLGDENILHAGSVIGGQPQDKKYHGEPTRLVVGSRNEFREHVTVNRGTAGGGGVTTVGDDNMLLASCHVAHDCEVGSRIVLANGVLLAGHVRVEDDCIMSGSSAIHQFGTVGRLSYIGGLTRLARDAAPFMVTEGHPARVVKVNAVGMRRSGIPAERIELLQRAFRYLFRRRHATLRDSFQALERDGLASPELDELRVFLEKMAGGRGGRAREAERA